MDILLLKTERGLIPASDSDQEKYISLKNGHTYKAKFIIYRNYDFHKKYFALINCAWAYLNEKTTDHFKTVEQFRKTVEMSAGHCDLIFSIKRKEWIETPKSIAFDKMNALEFQTLYEAVKTVLYAIFLKHITQEEFEKNLINF